MLYLRALLFVIWGGLIATSCRRESPVPSAEKPTPYSLAIPEHFPEPYLSDKNPLTVEGIQLGRMLFYDPILSGNGRTCGGCHLQKLAFINSNTGMGLDPKLYNNIPSLSNLAFKKTYTWTGGSAILDSIPATDFGPLFFNSDMDTVVARLRRHPEYPKLFKIAFSGRDVLNRQEVASSVSLMIAQYLRTMISADSRFDKFLSGEIALSEAEMRGLAIYFSEKGDCFHCHGVPLFTDNSYHNIGLDDEFTQENSGRYSITGKPADMGKYRTPSLRNIELTAPYMHDGRYKTLEEAIEHYNSRIKKSATLDPLLTRFAFGYGMELTQQEKDDLKAFLQTLTDETFINDPQFSNPF